MRKMLLTTAATAASLGLAVAAQAATVTFTGTVGAANETGFISDPAIQGQDFTITMDFDENAVIGDGINSLDSAFSDLQIMIGDASNGADFLTAQLINVSANASAGAQDQLSFDFVVEDDPLAGNYSIDFTFMNGLINAGDTLGDIIGDDGTMGTIAEFLCAHFAFNLGGFKYDGMLDDDGINVDDDSNVIPLPGAAVFMLSGLAAAGAGAARRRRTA